MSILYYNLKKHIKIDSKREFVSVKPSQGLRYIIHKHGASTLHYDFRIEMDGLMKSWSIPKGPSQNPAEKRLAIPTDDHLISANNYEGDIPKGPFGGGQAIVWDKGHYRSLINKNKKDTEREFIHDLKKGKLKFNLIGKKLRGAFTLFKFKDEKHWMLVKLDDKFVSTDDVTNDPRSVVSNKILIGKSENIIKYKNYLKNAVRTD